MLESGRNLGCWVGLRNCQPHFLRVPKLPTHFELSFSWGLTSHAPGYLGHLRERYRGRDMYLDGDNSLYIPLNDSDNLWETVLLSTSSVIERAFCIRWYTGERNDNPMHSLTEDDSGKTEFITADPITGNFKVNGFLSNSFGKEDNSGMGTPFLWALFFLVVDLRVVVLQHAQKAGASSP